jgi:hypothetical protein
VRYASQLVNGVDALGYLQPAAKRLRSRVTHAACEATLSKCVLHCVRYASQLVNGVDALGYLQLAAKRLRNRHTHAACEATLSRCAAVCAVCLAGAGFRVDALGHLQPAAKRLCSRATHAVCEAYIGQKRCRDRMQRTSRRTISADVCGCARAAMARCLHAIHCCGDNRTTPGTACR